METETLFGTVAPPLSDEEAAAWEALVAEGHEMLAPKREALEAKRAENRAKLEASRDYKIRDRKGWKSRSRNGIRNDCQEPSDGVKRFVVARASGMSFGVAAASAGVSWNEVMVAKGRSTDLREAMTAMNERSRCLMREKALSVAETSLDEGAKPNFAQLQMAGRVLAALDREHFGETRGGGSSSEESPKQLGGGGFVINVIGDAAAVAATPVPKTGKALVYTDV